MKQSVVAFGEILLRLCPPGGGLISNAKSFEASYGGTESNVLVALSGLGHPTKYVSVIPANAFGVGVEQHLHRYGVDTQFVRKQGDILGSYYLEEGFGCRPASVIYNRKHSEIAQIDETAFSPEDYDALFAQCGLFHISGISFGLSAGCRALSWTMVREAKKRGIPVSFDCNYRQKVWGAYPAEEFRKILKEVDIVFCSQKDLDAMGVADAGALFENSSCKVVCKREREMTDTDTLKASCTLLALEAGGVMAYSASTAAFPVKEKIGGGDAFDAGILHCLLTGSKDMHRTAQFALACYEIKHTVTGDVLWVTEQQVAELLDNQNRKKGVNR